MGYLVSCYAAGMNDARDTSHDVTDHATSRDTVTVVEAAVALGVTEGAVRARLRRGSLAGEKRGDTWVVDREALIAALGETVTRRATARTHDATSRDTSGDGTSPDALNAHLQEEVAYLREQLASTLRQLASERERADVLQREALGRIEEALSTSVSDRHMQQDAGDGDEPTASQHGVWARLRRWWGGQ